METNEQIKRHFFTFSEAIREGAKLGPQAFRFLSLNGANCAIGAGLRAMGLSLIHGCAVLGSEPAVTAFPYLDEAFVTCPVDALCGLKSLFFTVMDLNDNHHWTREQIADWLESEEEKLGYVTLVESESSQPEVSEVVMV